MKNKLILFVVIVALIGGWIILRSKKSDPMVNVTEGNSPIQNPVSVPVSSPNATSKPTTAKAVRSYTVLGSNFAFTPKQLLAKKGDTVTITFQNQSGFHDFKIDAFKVATKQINGGKSETVTFVASKSGTFEYYCSVANHRAMGMVGTLTVTE